MVYSRSNCWWVMSSADTHQQQPQPSHAERRLFACVSARFTRVFSPRSRRRLLGSDLQPFALHLLQRGLEIHQLQHTGWVRTPAGSDPDSTIIGASSMKKKSLSVYWNGKAAKILSRILFTLSFRMTGWRSKLFHLCSGCSKALQALLLCVCLSLTGSPYYYSTASRTAPPSAAAYDHL